MKITQEREEKGTLKKRHKFLKWWYGVLCHTINVNGLDIPCSRKIVRLIKEENSTQINRYLNKR